MNNVSAFRRIVTNAGIVLVGSTGANVLGLLSIAIFTHSMGPKIFGYYVLMLTFIEIIDRLFNFQTWQAFIKYAIDFQIKNENHNLMKLLKYCFLIDLISLSIAFFVALLSVRFFISYFNIPIEYSYLVELLSASLLCKVFEVSTGIFRIFDEFRVQVKIVFYSALIKFILYCFIYLKSGSFEEFVYASVLVQLIAMLIKFFFVKKVLNRNGYNIIDITQEPINHKLMKELKIFSFIVYNNFDVSVRMVSRQLDTVILGRLYGAEVVGIYKIAKEVAGIVSKLTDPIYQAIYPELARLLAVKNTKAAVQISKSISFYIGFGGLFLYSLFVVFGSWAIDFSFGVEFNDAYMISLFYFIAVLVAAISIPLVPMLFSYGLAKEALYNQIAATLIYSVVVYPLALGFGAIGAATAYIIFYLSWVVLTLRVIKSRILPECHNGR